MTCTDGSTVVNAAIARLNATREAAIAMQFSSVCSMETEVYSLSNHVVPPTFVAADWPHNVLPELYSDRQQVYEDGLAERRARAGVSSGSGANIPDEADASLASAPSRVFTAAGVIPGPRPPPARRLTPPPLRLLPTGPTPKTEFTTGRPSPQGTNLGFIKAPPERPPTSLAHATKPQVPSLTIQPEDFIWQMDRIRRGQLA